MSINVTTPEARDPTDVLDAPEAGGLAIRGSALRAGGYIAGALVTVISAPLLFRHLGVVDFGRYVTVLSLIAIVAGVTDAGLGTVAMREFAAQPPAQRKQFMKAALGARIVLCVVGVVGATLFAFVAGYGGDLVLGTALGGVGLVISVIAGTYAVPLGAGLRLGWMTIGDFGRAVATVILVVALVLAGARVAAFLAVPIPTALGVLALNVVLVRKTIPLWPALRPRHWMPLIRQTLPYAIATVLGTLYFRMAIVIMSLIATGLETGYFATSYRITEILAGIPLMVIGTMFPVLSRAAQGQDARLAYALQRIFEGALICGVWMTLSTAIGARFAVETIGGHAALPAAGVLRIQAIALTTIFLNVTWGTALLSLRRHREILVVNSTALATVVAGTFVLVPVLHAEGAALAVVIAETVLMLMAGWFVLRSRQDLSVDLRLVPRVALGAGVAALVALAPPLPEVAAVAVFTLAYVAMLLALRALPPEILNAFAERLAPRRAAALRRRAGSE